MKKLTTEAFISKCKEIHGDKYDYSLVNYNGSHTNITLICPYHGQFSIQPSNHLSNKGCRKCSLEKVHKSNKLSVDEFILRCEKLKEYEYSNIHFTKLTDKITLICKLHGEFSIQARNLLRNCGCPKCKHDKKRKTNKQFIEESNEIHKEKYNYDNCQYVNAHAHVCVACPEHGSFSIKPDWHLAGGKCPKCTPFTSIQEIDLNDFLQENNIKTIQPYRGIQGTKEIDIYCPEYSIGIEYNGLYWHSDLFKDKHYHYKKTELAASQGIRLLHIFDDEWQLKKDICKSRLMSIFGKSHKIWARKTTVREVDPKESSHFLQLNHIQGKIPSKCQVGLYLDEELVSIMTFGNYRVSLGRDKKQNCFELLRFCNKNNTTVIGGASKLFSWFLENYKPIEVISYSDIRWSVGNLYQKLGFKFVRNTSPNYFYTDGSLKRYNRFKYRKDVLVKLGYDQKLSEREITANMGLYRVYDCGNKLYCYKQGDLI